MEAIVNATSELGSEWRNLLFKYLDPECVNLRFNHHMESFLGRSTEQAAILDLLMSFADLEQLPVMYAVVASHETAVSRFSDSRVQNLVKKKIEEPLDTWIRPKV